MKLILDTSILIDQLRGGSVWQKIYGEVRGRDDIELYVSIIVTFELFSGESSRKEKEVTKIKALLKNFQRVELTEKIAQRAGELFRDIGSHIDPADYIIAASALEENAKIVTLNKKHFEKIPGINIFDF